MSKIETILFSLSENLEEADNDFYVETLTPTRLFQIFTDICRSKTKLGNAYQSSKSRLRSAINAIRKEAQLSCNGKGG